MVKHLILAFFIYLSVDYAMCYPHCKPLKLTVFQQEIIKSVDKSVDSVGKHAFALQ